MLAQKEDRLDLLLNVKVTVSEKSTEVSAEIKQLINREADMLNRGRRTESFRGVRERILKLFLYYIQNEEMNPELTLTKMRKTKVKLSRELKI